MAITHYDKYMNPAASKGKFAAYPDSRADSLQAASKIEYGKAVELTGQGNTQAQTFQGGKLHGVALAREYYDYTKDNPSLAYEKLEEVPVVRMGVIWVEVVGEVEAGDKAFVDSTTGDFTTGEGTDKTEMPGAVFKSSANKGELAKLELNLP